MKKTILLLFFGLCSFQLCADVVINELHYNPDGDDSAAGDLIFGGFVPSMPNATYVWYYFKLLMHR